MNFKYFAESDDSYATFERIKRTKPRRSDNYEEPQRDRKRDKKGKRDYSEERNLKRGNNDE